jgi:agmatine deiminase
MGSARALGRRVMPAEWSAHRATWLAWPHHASDWPGKLSSIHWVYVELVRHLSVGERVAMVFQTPADERRAMSRLIRSGVDAARVECYQFPTDRSWVRDSGGTFIHAPTQDAASEVTLIDWRFNGWAKYDNWYLDDRLPGRIATTRRLPRVVPRAQGLTRPVVLEGGAIDVNGRGAALATEQCLLDDTIQVRNPRLGRPGLERALRDYLGITTLIWLGQGIAGDDTHGHVDDVARFVGPRTVVAAVETDPSDANHDALADNLQRLRAARVEGEPLTVVSLPMPRPLWHGAQRLPASYLNFYIANAVVLVPTFNDPADRVALALLADLFPSRTVIGIHAVDLVLGLGTVHCSTLQEPAATLDQTLA